MIQILANCMTTRATGNGKIINHLSYLWIIIGEFEWPHVYSSGLAGWARFV